LSGFFWKSINQFKSFVLGLFCMVIILFHCGSAQAYENRCIILSKVVTHQFLCILNEENFKSFNNVCAQELKHLLWKVYPWDEFLRDFFSRWLSWKMWLEGEIRWFWILVCDLIILFRWHSDSICYATAKC